MGYTDTRFFSGQFVIISSDGLKNASGLVKSLGSYDNVVAACDGWWLGRVILLIMPSGNQVVTPPFTERPAKKVLRTDKRAKDGEGKVRITWEEGVKKIAHR